MLLFSAFIYVLIIILMIFEDNSETNKISTISIIAHRGASGYAPENTMISFEKALDLKADFIELDIQMTKDGELIIIHDSTIDRTTNGTGNVRDFLLTDIKKFDAGSWFHPSFSNETIPTLDEVLKNYVNKTGLLLELKDPHLYPGVERKLASLLKQKGLQNNQNIIVQSFDTEAIQRFHQLLPDISTAILVTSSLSNKELHKHIGNTQYINPNFLIANPQFTELLNSKGFKSFIWTINNMESYHAVSNFNVEGIITDYPDLLQKYRYESTGQSLKGKDIVPLLQMAYQLFLDLYEKIKKNF